MDLPSVSGPKFDAAGGCTATLRFCIGNRPIVLELRAGRALADELRRLVARRVSFEGRRTDEVAHAVSGLCADEYISRALAELPFSSTAAQKIADAVRAYCAVQEGRGHEIVARMIADAEAGGEEAKEALDLLDSVHMAVRLHEAAHSGSAQVRGRFGAIAEGLARGDRSALEAYGILDAVHRVRGGKEFGAAPIHLSMSWTGRETAPEIQGKIGNHLCRIAFGGRNPRGDELCERHLSSVLARCEWPSRQFGRGGGGHHHHHGGGGRFWPRERELDAYDYSPCLWVENVGVMCPTPSGGWAPAAGA